MDDPNKYQRATSSPIRKRIKGISVIEPLRRLAIIAIVPLWISACIPDENPNDDIAIESQPTNQDLKVSADIEDKIINSYALVASRQSHICPKLIQKNVDNTVIKRTSEVMINNSCDYFLYPKVGEQIAVNTNQDQIEALLITPKTYNFANGNYDVTSYDKHVIRLNYNGATHKPKRFNYDVTITIEKP